MRYIMDNYMERIYNLLQDIRKRYGMYIGAPSLERLSWFLAGYESAIKDMFIPQCGFKGDFNFQFQRFVENKDNAEDNMGKHWSKIISSGKTEEEAFQVFFEYVDEFFKGI